MGDPGYPLRDALSIMRMPLYFFLSGLFFKTYGNYSGFLKRKINKLLIPFLFFRFASCLISSFFGPAVLGGRRMFDFLVGQMQAPNTPIWFLICLFWLNQMFYGVYKISSRFKNFVAVLSGLSLAVGILGFYLGTTNYDIKVMNIGSAMTAMPFFCCGYLFNRHTDILYPNRWDKYLLWAAMVCAVYTILFARSVDYFSNSYESSLWITYSCGLTGVLCVLFLSKMIGRLPLISYFGRYSIMILVTHMPILQRLHPYFMDLPWPLWSRIALCITVALLSYILLIPIMKKWLPHVTAQKDLIPVTP